MKPSKRISLLLAAVTAIVMFWLAPGINTARDTRYTRRYEDTDKAAHITASDTSKRKVKTRQASPSNKDQSKTYKKETIESTSKLSKIKATQFSRAIHFEEEKIIVDLDSVQEIELTVVIDTTHQIH